MHVISGNLQLEISGSLNCSPFGTASVLFNRSLLYLQQQYTKTSFMARMMHQRQRLSRPRRSQMRILSLVPSQKATQPRLESVASNSPVDKSNVSPLLEPSSRTPPFCFSTRLRVRLMLNQKTLSNRHSIMSCKRELQSWLRIGYRLCRMLISYQFCKMGRSLSRGTIRLL